MHEFAVTDFERQVLEDLAEIKANMRWLLGDGNPGYIQELAERVDRHERVVQRLAGIGCFLATLLTLLHVGLDYFRMKR
jgi:hypothetical protein